MQMIDAPPEPATVTVPRWALDFVLQNADCDDAGGHQSSEMIAARYHLELAMEKPVAHAAPQTTLSHRWKFFEGEPRCCQCGKLWSDMQREWPHNMMVCPINVVRQGMKVEFCNG
jgi:hypothetical protein